MDEYEELKKNTKRYHKIKKILKDTYNYDSFKPKQYEIINRIISGEDVCAILPTGYGKSLTYQIPAFYLDQPAIIISPLISLMDDQRLILENLGIDSCCYNSNVENKYEMKKEILEGKYKFIYITPESIINIKDLLIKLEKTQGISLFAIDEAHCISSYGFDFRKSYRELTFFKETFPEIPILAVTATATETVGKDICKVLGFENDEPIKTSFDRPNLYIEVRKKSAIGKDIIPIINKYPEKAIIIYCLTKKETSKINETLKVFKIKSAIYHAGLSIEDRANSHKKFMEGKVKIMVATIAFGMGINKSNVRVVIHYGAPKNIEGYYQEIGRAGRDGRKSYCYAFYNTADFKLQEHFIANMTNQTYQKVQMKLLDTMKKYLQTDQCRRKLLLEYFDEEMKTEKCDFCDNCCNKNQTNVEKNILSTQQDVHKEAKMLIELIESMKDKTFGLSMYINILRGSNNKNITSIMKKNKFYNKGKQKSAEWWKEMSDNLITLGFLKKIYLKGGRFPMQVISVSQKGLLWSNMQDLNDVLDDVDPRIKLDPIKMNTAI